MPIPNGGLDSEQLDAERRRARKGVQRERRARARRIVLGITVVSMAVGALADAAPTEIALLDVLYQAGFAGLVTIAASRAKRWTWFVAAGAAGAAGGGAIVALVLSVGALALGYFSVLHGRRQRELGAVVGALTAQSLLRLPTDLAFAVPTAVAALAPLPLLFSALANVRRPGRYLLAVGGIAALLAAVGGAFAFAMLDVQDHVSNGIRSARAGLAAARSGDDPTAEAAFALAEGELASVADIAGAWWLRPARGFPVLAQHVTAVERVATEGRALAALSGDQVATLDISGLSSPDGGFELSRIAELLPRATAVAVALERTEQVIEDANSPWLVAPAASRLDDFAAEVSSATPAARNAADALALAPELLGASGRRTYLVLVGNPAESRELGGFTGGIGTLTADEGRLQFETAAGISAVNAQVAASGLELEGDLPPPLPASDPQRFSQNWTNTVDFSATADIATQLGPAVTGAPIDGVLYLDPYAVAGILELSGPVSLEGREQPLSSSDAVDYLLRDQYADASFDDDGQRKERLAEAAELALDQLLDGTLPDPRRVADVLSGAVQARRLLFTTTAEGPHPLLERVGLRATLDTGAPDQLIVAQENLRANKLDAYLQRELTYELAVDDGGSAAGTLTVALTNSTPDGLDDYVTGDGGFVRTVAPLPETLNRISLDVYSPLDVTGVLVDGEPSPSATTAVGRFRRTSVRVDVPSGTTVTVALSLSGKVDASTYDLAIVPNGTAATDTVAAELNLDGQRLVLERRPVERLLRVGAADL